MTGQPIHRLARHRARVVFASGLAGLLFMVLAAPAAADLIVMKDGKLHEGEALKDGAKVVIVTRFGPLEVKAADVERIVKGTSIDEQVAGVVSGLAEDDAQGRLALAEGLARIGRGEEARSLASAVLELEPENAAAHKLLGHVRFRGAWMSPDDAQRARGLVRHGDRWYTPAEWENAPENERAQAQKRELERQQKEEARLINEAVRMMMSPDPGTRAKGKQALEALAKETGSTQIPELIAKVEAFVAKVEQLKEQVRRYKERAASATASPDHARVLTEIRATYSKLKRPIQVFETSLASSGGGAPVRIQLPELELVKVRTTVGIPTVVDDR